MLHRSTVTLACLCVVASCAPYASAQVGDLIENAGVGVSIGAIAPVDDDVGVGATWGVTFGLAPSPGWGWTGSLGWFSGDLSLADQPGTPTVGSFKVRPIMGGVGYTWMKGKLATTASITAGISFNSAEIDDDYREAFGPGTRIDLDMDNSFALRPAIEIEYAVSPKFAITGWTGFFFTSINSTLQTSAGTFEDEWNASSFTVTVGAMVYPFR